MEIGSVSRPAAPLAPAPVHGAGQPVAVPKTPQQAVEQPAAVIETSTADARRRAMLIEQLNEESRGSFVQDPNIKEMVYREVDKATGQVTLQLPTEETLKMRAYREALEKAQSERVHTTGVTA